MLSVNLEGTGSGVVRSSPAGIDCGDDCSNPYPGGTPVTLTATATTGSTFEGWSADRPHGSHWADRPPMTGPTGP